MFTNSAKDSATISNSSTIKESCSDTSENSTVDSTNTNTGGNHNC